MRTPVIALIALVASAQCVFGSPTITNPPQSRALRVGDHVAFVLSATGSGTLSYQWSKDGANINGATTTSLSLTNLQLTNSGTYTITVNDSSLQPTTANAVLSVSSGLLHLFPTNLVVLHSGDGIAALAATGNTTYLDQFTTDGVYVSSVMVPDKGATSLIQNSGLTDVYMSSLSNNRAVVFGGYNTNKPGPSLGASTATAVPRGIGMINGLGYYTLALSDTNTVLNGQKVSAVGSLDGTAFWFASGSSSGSVIFSTNGADTTIITTPAGRTGATIFNNDYYATLSGGIYHFAGLPTGGSSAQQAVNSGG
ncbi:MAG: immunoglobulin domain-containing protein, partial [Limisphaerales bacterium]